MARPPRFNADYFTHSADLRNDRRVKAIRTAFGATGYGIFIMLLESLADADHTALAVDEMELELLAGDFGVPATDIDSLLQLATRIGYFKLNEAGLLTCPELDEWLAPVFDKRNRAKAAANNGEKSNAPWMKHARAVLERDGGCCVSCGTTNDLTLDHIMPRVAGGSDEMGNLQTLCTSCNSRKGAKLPISVTVIPQSKGKERKEEERKEEDNSSLRSEPAADAAVEPEKKIEGAELQLESPAPADASASHTGGAADVGTRIKRGKLRPAEPECFAAFWQSYSRHDDRAAAVAAFRKLSPADQQSAATRAAAWLKARPDLVSARGDFRPHASTWLNKARWTDDAPITLTATTTNPQQYALPQRSYAQPHGAAARLHTPAPDPDKGWGYPGG